MAKSLEVLRITVAGRTYCFDIARVNGIHDREGLREAEESSHALGRLPLGTTELPVFRLAALTGCAGVAPSSGERLIVELKANPSPFGLVVDRVEPALAITAEGIVAAPRLIQPRERRVYGAALLIGEEASPLLDPDLLHPAAREQGGQTVNDFTQTAPLPSVAPRADSRLLLARLGASDFIGLSIRQLEEILGPRPLQALPGAPAFVTGLLAWRGRAVPVVDAAQLLGLPRVGTSRILVARGIRTTPIEYIALQVSDQIDVVSLSFVHHRIEWFGDPEVGSFLLGTYRSAHGRIAMLDLDVLLAGATEGALWERGAKIAA